jgi:hypothetical protein
MGCARAAFQSLHQLTSDLESFSSVISIVLILLFPGSLLGSFDKKITSIMTIVGASLDRIPLLLLLLFLPHAAISFTATTPILPALRRSGAGSTLVVFSTSPPSAASSSAAAEEADATTTTVDGKKSRSKKTSKLVFDAKIYAESQPMDAAALSAYFPTRDFRIHSLSSTTGSSGETTRIVRDVEWDDVLTAFFYETYQDQVGAELPPFVHAVETCVQFPGLQVINSLTIAFRLVHIENANDCYAYETFMVSENKRVSGPAPLVWLFEKLVHAPKAGPTKPSGKAYTRFSQSTSSCDASTTTPTSSSSCCTVIADSSVAIEVSFPAFLLRILPASPEKMQAQGSAAVRKAIARDIDSLLTTLPGVVAARQ